MKKKGFTLIEVLIAIAISSTVLVIAYSMLNNSTTFIKRNIETIENKSNIELFQRIITKDIKNSKMIDLNSYVIDNITYYLKFNKVYGEKNLYSLIRKVDNEETILLENILQDGFDITLNNGLYTIKIKYFETGLIKEYQFNIAKSNYSGTTSYEIPVDKNYSFEYKGYFITIDFANQPYVNLIESNNNLNTNSSNQLDFKFYSFDKNSSYDFKINSNNKEFIYNIGYKFDEEEKFKTGEYSLSKPFDLNLPKPKISGVYIKNIYLTKNKEITIDTSNCEFDVQLEIELPNENIKLISDSSNKNGNRDKNIKIFYNNGGLHYTNLKEIK